MQEVVIAWHSRRNGPLLGDRQTRLSSKTLLVPVLARPFHALLAPAHEPSPCQHLHAPFRGRCRTTTKPQSKGLHFTVGRLRVCKAHAQVTTCRL